MSGRISPFLRGAALAGLFASGAFAHEDRQFFVATPWQGPEMAQSRLIVAPGAMSEDYADGEGIVGGLHVKLQPGWFTYWRTPGESGLPPAFEWDDSVSVESVRVMFPAPEHKVIEGVSVNGYSDEVVLPVVIVPSRAHGPMTLRLKARYAVCRDVCVPVETVHVLDMKDASEPMSAKGVVRAEGPPEEWYAQLSHLAGFAGAMAEWGLAFLAHNMQRIEDAAERAAEIAEREGERAAERAERERERSEAQAERERERAEEQAQAAEEEAEKARERAERERERVLEEAERAREKAEEARERAREEIARALELLQEALERVPDAANAAVTIHSSSANIVEANGRRTLTIRIRSDNPFRAPQAFVEGPGLVIFGGSTTEISEDGHMLTISAPISRSRGTAIDGRWVTVTVVDGRLVFEERLKVSPRAPVATPWTPQTPVARSNPDAPIPPEPPAAPEAPDALSPIEPLPPPTPAVAPPPPNRYSSAGR